MARLEKVNAVLEALPIRLDRSKLLPLNGEFSLCICERHQPARAPDREIAEVGDGCSTDSGAMSAPTTRIQLRLIRIP